MTRAPVLVGVGAASVDVLGLLPARPAEGGRHRLRTVSIQGGGVCANALVAAAAVGVPARMVSRVADDLFGRFAVAALEEAGVDTRFVERAGVLTPFAFVAVQDADRRTVYSAEGDTGDLDPGKALEDGLLTGAGALLIDGTSPAAAEAVARAARGRGLPVWLDLHAPDEDTRGLIGLADVLVVSEHTASALVPHGETETALAALAALGPGTVVLTLGAGGSVARHGGETLRQAAFTARAVDARGAGDVFTGTLAGAHLLGISLIEGLELASAAAALSVAELGARAALASLDELRAIVARTR